MLDPVQPLEYETGLLIGVDELLISCFNFW